MTIDVKFSSTDIAGKLRDGAYELPDDATIATLMDFALRESGYEMPDEQRREFVFILDNSPAYYDTKLRHGAKLRVLFRITGG
jgi:hypothetical protein